MYRFLIVDVDVGIARGVCQLITAWGMEAVVVQNFQNVVGEFAPPLISQPVPKCRLTASPRGKPSGANL